MNLAQALRLSHSPCLALVGAGGKTTALFRLARELTTDGRPVLVTATTHLAVGQIRLADSHRIARSPADLAGLEAGMRGVTLVTGPVDGDRTSGLDPQSTDWLRAVSERQGIALLIEADGSRRRPLKAPGENEPPIPEFVDLVLVVAGLSGLGRPLSEEFVHHPEAFARLSGLQPGDPVTAEALTRVLVHPEGGLKNVPAGARRIVLLNQADTPELQGRANGLAERLLTAYDAVVIASLDPRPSIDDHQYEIHAALERTAGIVLAAGGSRRMGQPKQLLDYHGQSFVRAAARTALEAGLSPVIVITGADAEAVEAAVRDLPVRIARNEGWQQGQSSSIRAGLETLTQVLPSNQDSSTKSEGVGGSRVGAVLFLLADQPQVTPEVLRALVERHSRDLPPVVAPLVRDQRANPVLFDRATFPALMALSGDVGGRAIFSRFPPAYLPWHDERLLVDADRPEDLKKLRD